jgi:hypothetical protein
MMYGLGFIGFVTGLRSTSATEKVTCFLTVSIGYIIVCSSIFIYSLCLSVHSPFKPLAPSSSLSLKPQQTPF